jgi:hypothetical protein
MPKKTDQHRKTLTKITSGHNFVRNSIIYLLFNPTRNKAKEKKNNAAK